MEIKSRDKITSHFLLATRNILKTTQTITEIGETQERLHVLDFPQFGPILDDFDLIVIHSESAWSQDIAKILDRVLMKETFIDTGI